MNNELLSQARQRLSAGRIIAKSKAPYYSRGLDSIEVFEREGLGKITIDRYWRLYYDPEECLKLSSQEVAAIWLHNLEHLFRNHPQRFEALENKLAGESSFNKACDALINSDLAKQGVFMPNSEKQVYIEDGAGIGWKPNMSAEQLYYLSLKASESNESGQDDSDGQELSNRLDNPAEGDTEANSGRGEEDNYTENHNSDKESSDPSDKNLEDEDKNKNSSNIQDDDEVKPHDSTQGENKDGVIFGEPNKPFESFQPESERTDSTDPEGEQSLDNKDNLSNSPAEKSHPNTSDKSAEQGSNSSDSSEDYSNDGSFGANNSESKSSENGKNARQEEKDTESSSEHPSDTSQNPSSEEDYDCGSGAGGELREYEEQSDKKALPEHLSETLKENIADDIMRYENSHPGSVPAGLLRDARFILEPDKDWTRDLLKMTRKVIGYTKGNVYQTYSRMAKKHSSNNAIILPGWQAPAPPQVAVIIDTSGSMGEKKEIALALGSLQKLMKTLARNDPNKGLHIISCDAQATASFVSTMEEVNLIGGGGTDMGIGIKLAAEMRPLVDVVIVITDGGTPWPKSKPRENLKATYIAVLTASSKSDRENVPEWMKTVEVNIPRARSSFSAYSK